MKWGKSAIFVTVTSGFLPVHAVVHAGQDAARTTVVAPAAESVQALSVQYADGRTSLKVLQGTGGFTWTPRFPRVAGANTVQNGLPLEALDLTHVVTAQDIMVTVSLLYGTSHQYRLPVATAHVRPDQSRRVDELTAYGVQPITLSVVAVPLTFTYLPVETCASAFVEMRVEPVATGVLAYQFVIVNRSSHAVKALQFEGYSGDQRVIAGRRRAERNEPLVKPNAEYTFSIPLDTGQIGPDGAPVWSRWDRVAITSVVWDDGLVEGDANVAAQERALDGERAVQINRVLAVLRSAADSNGRVTPEDVRRQLAANALTLSIGMQQVRDAAMADLGTFERGGSVDDARAFHTWLTRTVTEYEQWLARTVAP